MQHDEAQRGLALLIVATAALTGGLHLVGAPQGFWVDWSDPIAWLEGASADQAIAALLRLAGIVVGYWVLATTVLYAITARTRRKALRWIRVITLPGIRRVVDRALATAIAASIAAAPLTPAAAEEPPPVPPVVFDITTDGIPVPHIRLQENPSPEPAPDTTDVESPTMVRVPTAPVVVVAQPATASVTTTPNTRHTVERGDNLWLIADQHLHQSTGQATAEDVARYWRRVIEANESTLRSGDPNLIYPGEIVTLPELEIAP